MTQSRELERSQQDFRFQNPKKPYEEMADSLIANFPLNTKSMRRAVDGVKVTISKVEGVDSVISTGIAIYTLREAISRYSGDEIFDSSLDQDSLNRRKRVEKWNKVLRTVYSASEVLIFDRSMNSAGPPNRHTN